MSFENDKSERGVVVAVAVIIFGYLTCGAIISIIYHYLADGGWWLFSFLVTMCIGPVIIFIFIIFYPLQGWGWRRWVVFYGLAFYLFSPILLNGTSLLLKQIGHDQLGQQVFTVRYWALLKVPIVWLLYLAFTKIKGSYESKQIMDRMRRPLAHTK